MKTVKTYMVRKPSDISEVRDLTKKYAHKRLLFVQNQVTPILNDKTVCRHIPVYGYKEIILISYLIS